MTATTWILAADGNQARLLKGVNLLKDCQQNPEQEIFRWEPKKAQDIMADKPGRSHSSVGHGRSAMEYSSDPVREEQQKFTAEVAGRLGVKTGALATYKLPEPDATIGRTRGWLPDTIDQWNTQRPGRGVGGGRPRKHAE